MHVAWCFGCVCPFIRCVYVAWFKGNCRVGCGMLRLSLLWKVCCNRNANVCAIVGESKLCMHMIVVNDSSSWL